MNYKTYGTYSLKEIEDAIRTYHFAVLQATRDPYKATFTLGELRSDGGVLTGLHARAKTAPGNSLNSRECGGALSRVAFWHRRATDQLPSRSDVMPYRRSKELRRSALES